MPPVGLGCKTSARRCSCETHVVHRTRGLQTPLQPHVVSFSRSGAGRVQAVGENAATVCAKRVDLIHVSSLLQFYRER